IGVLEDDLKRTKQTYSAAFTKLILRIKKLESKVKTGKARKRARVVLSEDEEDDSSKQGRIDEDPNTYFHQDDEVDDDVVHDTVGKETRKYKGKAIMTKPEPEKKSKKLLEQERLGLEEVIRLQEQVDEEERAQIARDEEIARQLLALDEERATSEPKTTKDIDWNDPSVQKYWDLKNKPKSEAQARKNMIVYLKNQSNYKMKDFEGMRYDDIRPILKKVWDFNHNFVPMDLEIEKEKKKPTEFQEIEEEQIEKDTSKKTTGKRKKYLPRRRTRSTAKKQKVEQDDEKEELKNYLDIVPREDVAVDVESLSTKYPIVDWKTYTLSENFMYYKIIRGDGSSKNYKILSEMLYDFDRQDVVELYRLVKERYSSSKPEGYDLMLWGDLHTLFEPDEESEIWMNQNEYNLISWSLCDFCGVHILLMQNGIAIHMLTEKKYPLSQEMISKMLSKRLEVDQESTQAYELLKVHQIQAITTAATTTTTAVTRPKARGVVVQEPSEFTTTTSPSQPSQLPQAKDKGKEKMVEPKKPLKKKDQIMFDKEVAQKLQAQLDAELEEEEKLARQREEDANIAEWDNVQAMMDVDYELAARLQAEEQGELTIEEKSRLFMELINKRKKHFARLGAEDFKDIQMLFDKEMKRVNTFVDMDTELVKGSETRTEESSKRVGKELEYENLKKQKLDEKVEAEVDDEAEMKEHMEIVLDDEVAIDAIPLATKPPIIVD
ncbi:hypothetical protein Tco_1097651, partial [Tanacetum coccineum]